MDDSVYMKRALQLAKRGTGRVSPNPRVGAVIVRDGKILSEGYHHQFGQAHAEVDALSKCNGNSLRNTSLYVNLEPCSHFGKTPPCVNAILQSGISEVIIGMTDPNPLVSGKGIAKLKSGGIRVKTGVLQDACQEINRAYIKYIQTGLPYVTLKIAQTLDGRIAVPSGKSKWITGETSRKQVHRMRQAHDAVLVGVDTVIQDDPLLTPRAGKRVTSRRIILDSKLRIPDAARVLRSSHSEKTILITTRQADPEKIERIRQNGVEVWQVAQDQSGRVRIQAALKRLGKSRIASVLVEGGSRIFSAFIEQKLFDELVVFMAPVCFGSGLSAVNLSPISDPSKALKFSSVSWKKAGQDMMFRGRI